MAYFEVVSRSGLKIREYPSLLSNVLEAMPAGMRVKSLDDRLWDGAWYRILAEFSEDYVVEGYSHHRHLHRLPEDYAEQTSSRSDGTTDEADIQDQPSPRPLSEQLYRVNASSLNLRAKPTTEAAVIVSMKDGAIVEKLADSENLKWWKVEVTVGKVQFVGYAHNGYLAALNPPRATSFDMSRLSDITQTIADVRSFVGDYAEALNVEVLDQLKSTLFKYGILENTRRLSHFIAQLAHESGKFSRLTESMNYSAPRIVEVFGKHFSTVEEAAPFANNEQALANKVYANIIGNGDEQSGDGYRFRGRGFIQLTGRTNYVEIGRIIGKSLVDDPDIVASDPVVALETSAAYWHSRNLNSAADHDDLERVTKGINAALLGLDDRRKYLNQAKSIWGG